MRTPSTTEKRKLVRLLAAYVNADGAHIRVQERAYGAWMSYFERLEARYPGVAFRSSASVAALTGAAKREAAKKLFRGPGSTR